MHGSIPLLVLNVAPAGARAVGRFVTAAGAYPSAGAGARGVTRTSAAAAGDLVPITVIGTEVVECGGTVTAQGPVMTDNTGRAVNWTSGNTVLGYAQGAGASGDFVEVLLVSPSA